MRASTLFALTIAVLVGLGVAVAVRVSGMFSPRPAPPVAKQPEIRVVVAAKNLFAGDMIDGTGVMVRVLRADEVEHYRENKQEYLPPVSSAAVLRIAKTDIPADQPILKGHLQKMAKPEALHTRLMPSMRAVSVSVAKDNCAGGVIQIGEWVDVLLTSAIEDPSGKTTTRTAPIAARVRIIAKRNTLWPVFAPLRDDTVQFTLEVNPYRAALIEYCKSKGVLTLTPLPDSEQRKLEGQRARLLERPDGVQPVSFVQAGTPEAGEEEARVSSYSRGELAIGEGDLMRIFGVTTQPPPVQRVAIHQMAGVRHYAPAVFSPASGERIMPSRPGALVPTAESAQATVSMATGFQFRAPEGCGAKRKG